MQIQIQSVDAQVKGLQFSLNKLATKDELAAVQNNADFRIGEVEQCLEQEMESRCQRMDESIHDLGDRVTSVERIQSAAVQQVTDARSDSPSACQSGCPWPHWHVPYPCGYGRISASRFAVNYEKSDWGAPYFSINTFYSYFLHVRPR